MKIVIQCAGSKNPQPGLGFNENGKLVKFVADSTVEYIKSDPHTNNYVYVRPDDICARPDYTFENQYTWRKKLLDYNKEGKSNPLGLLPAYKLYAHKVYENLVNKFGENQVFILSAGWGLIRSDFLTPDYDITFSNAKNVKSYAHRRKSDNYDDLCQLPNDGDTIVFIGGKDYLHLFCKLTKKLPAQKIVFYNSNKAPDLSAYGSSFLSPVKFITKQKTNWHYTCAQDLIDGKIKI